MLNGPTVKNQHRCRGPIFYVAIIVVAKPQGSRLKRALMMLKTTATCWENDRKPQIIIFIIGRMARFWLLAYLV